MCFTICVVFKFFFSKVSSVLCYYLSTLVLWSIFQIFPNILLCYYYIRVKWRWWYILPIITRHSIEFYNKGALQPLRYQISYRTVSWLAYKFKAKSNQFKNDSNYTNFLCTRSFWPFRERLIIILSIFLSN